MDNKAENSSPTTILSAMSGVYQIVCRPTGKRYIGSSQNMKRRWKDHRNGLRGNYHYNDHLQKAWNKHGESAFRFEIIELIEGIEELLLIEQRYLSSEKPEFNCALDAQAPMLGRKHSPKAKAKIGKAHRGKKMSPETRARISKANLGKKHSPKAKAKMSEAKKGNTHTLGRKRPPKELARLVEVNLGKKMSPETKAKIGKAIRGKKRSLETRAKMSEALIGNTRALGRKQSPEHKKKRINALKAYWKNKKAQLKEEQTHNDTSAAASR